MTSCSFCLQLGRDAAAQCFPGLSSPAPIFKLTASRPTLLPISLQSFRYPLRESSLNPRFDQLSCVHGVPYSLLNRSIPFQNPKVDLDLNVSASANPEPQTNNHGFDRKRLAVFVSGGGSNFRALHQSALENKIYGDVVVVVTDKPECKACDYAKINDIPVIEYPRRTIVRVGLSPTELVAVLRQYGIDYVLLAGYLKLLPGELIQAYPRCILNIHPALLPAFGGKGYYGMKVHEAVIKSGARFSGATVHFVDEKYDHGVIIAQKVVPVLPYDTAKDLAARVLKEEHNLFPEVLAALCEDRIFWREDGVPLIRKSWDEAEYY